MTEDDLPTQMREWRRYLHARPELGYEEHATAAFVRGLLDEWGVGHTAPLPTSVVATVAGSTPGPTLLVRADIDALPIQEQNEVDYASTVPGRMHACGHDGHTAILLGVAKSLAANHDQLCGEIRLVFQPAEELIDGGAEKLIEAGILDGVEAAVGFHLRSPLDTGVIGLRTGPVLASEDRFDITLRGAGGHAGSPHETIDALVVGAGLVNSLQTLTSRRVDPLDSAVVSVGTFYAGDAYNVITPEARISGTVRTLEPATRNLLESELIRLSHAHADGHGATADVAYRHGSPPLVNDQTMVDLVRPAATAVVGTSGVRSLPARLGGDDFAWFSDRLPAVYAFIGAKPGASAYPHHHPRFDFDEDALDIGRRFLLEVVRHWSDRTQ